MEIRQIGRNKQIKGDPVKVKEKMDKLRKEHSKLIKGKFEFVDAGAGFIEFNYRYFPEDLLVTYKLFHDEICEIPMGIVKHLNNTVKKVRSFNKELSDRGLPSSYTRQSRVRFTNIDLF